MSRSLVVSAAMAELTKEARIMPGAPWKEYGDEWSHQFDGSPLMTAAMDLQKEDAVRDAERAQRAADQAMEYAQDAMFRVRVSKLEAQLQEWKCQQMGLGNSHNLGPLLGMAGGPAQAAIARGRANDAKTASVLSHLAGAFRKKKTLETGTPVHGTQQIGHKAGLKTAEYGNLAQKIEAGLMGKEAQAALEGILAARGIGTISHVKVASGFGPAENEGETDARKRRLAELLHKREPTGTDGGSASPNPTRDAT